MQTSPSIPEIASALASAPRRLSPRSLTGSSRILCLILQPLPNENRLRARTPAKAQQVNKTRSPRAVAEAFLRFSPRVQLREPNFLFIDIASTAHFFFDREHSGGKTAEEVVIATAVGLAHDLGFSTHAAISDTAAGAQAFAQLGRAFICPPGEEREQLQPLSLPLLLHLEGFTTWKRPREIEEIVTFFFMLGFSRIADLDQFSLASFQDRWGDTGALLWKRIHALENPPVSPLLPTEPLTDYVHVDFPISLLSLLLHQVRRSLVFLCARLQGRCLFARKIILRLHCEYSGKQHIVELEPVTPGRDLKLLLTLLENKLDTIDLENPIREYEIEVIACSERVHQLDFFEPRITDQDKLENLFSLQQSSIRADRYEVRESILPEKNWAMRTDTDPTPRYRQSIASEYEQVSFESDGAVALAIQSRPEEKAFARLPEYGRQVMQAPRPTRLLKVPRRLPIHELQKLQLLTGQPVERLEEAWWEPGSSKRDYYFAISPFGQCLWIYKDYESQEYFLHGYFD